jgi:hypothetical protein
MNGPGDSDKTTSAGATSGGVSSAGATSGGVIAGFFAFTEITEPSAHKAYNEWHQFDHLPEQLPIAGIASGQRWVATPACRAVTFSNGKGSGDEESAGQAADLSVAQYLTLYLMRGPLDQTLRAFYDLAVELHKKDRFFPHRRAIESGPLAVRELFAAPRVRVSPAAVPYRPNRGVYAVVTDPTSDRSEASSESIYGNLDAETAGELLRIDGVAGVWFFGPGRDTDERSRSESLDGSERGDSARAESEPAGSGSALRGEVALCFLDEDPVPVAEQITELLRPRWERDGRMPRLAGPYETIVPGSWDWFDPS